MKISDDGCVTLWYNTNSRGSEVPEGSSGSLRGVKFARYMADTERGDAGACRYQIDFYG
jgi:hypothetical protein